MANQTHQFTNIELAFFCNQLSMLLSSGISSAEGLFLMQEESDSAEEKEILSGILQNFENSGSLYEAFCETGLFPPYLLHMVKLGEETGKLEDVFTSLSRHYTREDSIKSSILHAITYPLIMTVMMLFVILVLLIKIMPIFNQVFIQLGSEMTGFAGMLVSLGNLLSGRILIVIALFLILSGVLYGFRKSILHRIPLFRNIHEKIAACRFASGMSLALSSGLNPELSLELVRELNEDRSFETKLDKCADAMENGEDLSKALVISGIFSGLHARMASIGYKSGTMDQVMNQIAESCQEEADNRIHQMLAVIEPTLVVVLSLIVGIILLSVMFPLIGIMASL